MTFLVADYLRVQYQYHDNTSNTDVWSTITGYITTLSIERPQHAAGVTNVSMFADALNPALHPSTDTHIRKGQKFRVQAYVGGTWKSQFTGTIGKVDTNPDYTKRDGRQFPLTVVAYDSVKQRHQRTGVKGVAKVDDLRATVTSPFKINGSTTAIAESATEELFDNDNASEWDQIQITRDSEEGFAHVDKEDTLVVYDKASKTTAVVAAITENNYTAKDLALNYTLENVINHVTVKQIEKYKNGKTHVKHKGIWKRQTSIDKYGYYKATFTIQGTRHDAATKAGNILDANADPSIVPTGCVIPVKSSGDVTTFVDTIDLNDKVTVRTPDGTVFTCRVDTIKHEVVGTSDKKNIKWNVTFTFINPVVRFRPTKKPSTGYGNVSDGQIETAHVDDRAITTGKVDDLAITSGKVADGAIGMTKVDTPVYNALQNANQAVIDIQNTQSYAETKNTVYRQATAPTGGTYTTNDVWFDTANGNKPMYWTGSAWASTQDASIATAQSTATAAQTSANGKNKVTYSTSAPTTQANTAGDIWWVRNATTGLITAQYEGQGGTTWASRTLDDGVIANLDAGKITTGTIGATISLTGPLFQTTATASRGIKITSSANSGFGSLIAYNSSGVATFNMNGQTGSLTMVGDLNTGSNVNGAIITGGTVQTTSTANRGVKISSTGMTAYNSTGGATFTIDASTGAVAMLGSLTSGSTISGATITGSTFTTAAAGQRIVIDSGVIKAYSGLAGETSPSALDPGSSTQPTINLYSGTTTTYGEQPVLALKTGTTNNSYINAITDNYYVQNRSGIVFMTVTNSGTTIYNGGTISGGLTVTSGGAAVTGNSTIAGTLSVNDSITCNADGTGQGFSDASWTTGTTTTASINSSGRIIRTSSSKRYKSNVRPLSMRDARKALDLEAVTYTLKEEAHLGDKRVRYPGFIAEQVDEAGAKLWVNYLEDGRPDGVQYAQLTAAHNMLIKDLYGTIDDLKAEVAELKTLVRQD